MILGIDIGGANTKIASDDGKIAELHYIPLWKNTRLPEALLEIAGRLKPEKISVVITGELADCFPDKEAGLSYIIDAVNNAFENAFFLDNNGNFTKKKIRRIAAANWMASSLLTGKDFGDCIFLDIGSTTTDIIPIKNGEPLAGKTDFKRLKKGELVYSGALRTNIAAILKRVTFGNMNIESRVSSELFAITADAYIVLDLIKPQNYTCDTPDGAGKTVLDAKRRLARVVCADLCEIQDEEIFSIASQVMEAQVNEIKDALCEISKKHGLRRIVSCGIGEFLAKKAAKESGLEIILISEKYGTEISKVFPAYAVAKLLKDSNL
ncbi:4-[[4-(2-aminoethyl)phenoxy]-methyl]-2-furanmethanamine-glutamate synthase [uncultured archaeon]|nr:4-[[4-(2-aminoethyl)phenoxy]-methyl]-2-furanmethanamine-glutamate synthase [uncultured archaeon]